MQDHFGQIVAHVPIRAAESVDEAIPIQRVTHRQIGEEQPRGPPLRTVLEVRNGIAPQAEIQDIVEELLRLLGGEGKIPEADFGEGAACPQPPQPDRGVDPGAQNELDVAGLVFGEQGDRLMTRQVGDPLVVVEDEHDVAVQRLEVAEDPRDRDPNEVRSTPKGRFRRLPEDGADPADRLDDVAPQDHRVVVRAVERDPGEGALVGLAPLGDECGLPEAGGRHDQDQLCRVRPKEGQQAGAIHRGRVEAWLMKLRRQDRREPALFSGAVGYWRGLVRIPRSGVVLSTLVPGSSGVPRSGQPRLSLRASQAPGGYPT